jgi:crotonobetainyl-CoA:carnitine CoA-transferase CaiB-like acyl-CoA transferase
MGMEIQIERKTKPTIRTVKFPLQFSTDATPHPAAPPELGEHNEEFLKSLGYDRKSNCEAKGNRRHLAPRLKRVTPN